MSLTKPATCCFICCSTASRDIPANRETKNRQAYRLKTSPQIPLKLGRQGAIQFDKLIPILKKVALSGKPKWFLYKTEGEPKGVSINSFCISNNIPYTAFYDWFKKTQKKIVPVEVEGIPEELIRTGNGEHDVTKDKPKRTTPHKGNIMITIRTP